MKENKNDQQEQKNPTGQQHNQGSQLNQGYPGRDDNSSSADTLHEKNRSEISKQDQFSSPETDIGHKTYAGIAESNHDSNQDTGANQDRNPDSRQNQGDQNGDEFSSSTNSSNEEDERDVSKQKEISKPEKERSTTTPHAGNSTGSNRDYNQNSDSVEDKSPIDDSTLLK